jgi:hypothetical protein
MLNLFPLTALQSKAKKFAIYVQAAVLVAAGLTPLAITGTANAAQLVERSVAISTSEPEATGVSYAFTFDIPSNTPVQGIVFEFCETPLGTCTLPTDMSVDRSVAGVSASQTFTEVTAFTEYGGADLGDCSDADAGASSTQYCVSRTEGDPETTAAGKAITLTGIVNPSIAGGTNNTPLYARIALYSDTSFATKVHEGTVAASINLQLTVNGRVQERLQFCVAAIGDGGATDTTLPTNMTNCTAVTDTVVDIGIIDNTSVARSPAENDDTSQGNDRYGIAMVNTNASNGVSIAYFAEPDGGGTNQLRSFRVPSASCNASDANLFDQCFRPATVANEIVAGDEYFGLNIPCIIADDGGAIVNSVETTTMNLVADGDYDNEGTTAPDADCENDDTDNYFQWNTSSSSETIATSAGSTNKVVDNEIVKLNFGASAEATTPTGSYTAISTYIATATY